jgi:hypothetical protein
MSPAKERRKGHDEERAVCRELQALGFEAETTRSNRLKRDADGVDVEAWTSSGAVRLAVQVKAMAKPRVKAAFLEAASGADEVEIPALVVRYCPGRGGRSLRLICLDWDDERVRALVRKGCGVVDERAKEALR